jgi:hypothetical protein
LSVANNAGVDQFSAVGQDSLRFRGTGSVSVTFVPGTKTVVIGGPDLNNIDINGGTIDGVAIGSASPGAGQFTSGGFTGSFTTGGRSFTNEVGTSVTHKVSAIFAKQDAFNGDSVPVETFRIDNDGTEGALSVQMSITLYAVSSTASDDVAASWKGSFTIGHRTNESTRRSAVVQEAFTVTARDPLDVDLGGIFITFEDGDDPTQTDVLIRPNYWGINSGTVNASYLVTEVTVMSDRRTQSLPTITEL